MRQQRRLSVPGERTARRILATEKCQQRLNVTPGIDRRFERRRLERQNPVLAVGAGSFRIDQQIDLVPERLDHLVGNRLGLVTRIAIDPDRVPLADKRPEQRPIFHLRLRRKANRKNCRMSQRVKIPLMVADQKPARKLLRIAVHPDFEVENLRRSARPIPRLAGRTGDRVPAGAPLLPLPHPIARQEKPPDHLAESNDPPKKSCHHSVAPTLVTSYSEGKLFCRRRRFALRLL